MMLTKKKSLRFGLLSLLFIVLLSNSVSASILSRWIQEGGILDAIFKELPRSDVGVRVLFGLAIFAVLFGVSELVLKDFKRNIRTILTLIMAIISVAFIPASALRGIGGMWGGLFLIILTGAPVVGLFYLLFTKFKEDTKGNYAIKFVLAIMITIIAMGAMSFVGETAGAFEVVGFNIINSYTSLLEFIGFITAIMSVFYLFKLFGPGAVSVGESIRERGGVKGFWKDMGREAKQLARGKKKTERALEDASEAAEEGDQEKAKKNLKKAAAELEENISEANQDYQKRAKEITALNSMNLSGDAQKKLNKAIGEAHELRDKLIENNKRRIEMNESAESDEPVSSDDVNGYLREIDASFPSLDTLDDSLRDVLSDMEEKAREFKEEKGKVMGYLEKEIEMLKNNEKKENLGNIKRSVHNIARKERYEYRWMKKFLTLLDEINYSEEIVTDIKTYENILVDLLSKDGKIDGTLKDENMEETKRLIKKAKTNATGLLALIKPMQPFSR